MKIIEGKAGKSKILERVIQDIQKQDDRILCIDTVGVLMAMDCKPISFIRNQTRSIEKEDHINYVVWNLQQVQETDFLNKISTIIFSLNADSSIINTLLNWEKKLNKNFVVTIQNNQLDEVIQYEVDEAIEVITKKERYSHGE